MFKRICSSFNLNCFRQIPSINCPWFNMGISHKTTPQTTTVVSIESTRATVAAKFTPQRPVPRSKRKKPCSPHEVPQEFFNLPASRHLPRLYVLLNVVFLGAHELKLWLLSQMVSLMASSKAWLGRGYCDPGTECHMKSISDRKSRPLT